MTEIPQAEVTRLIGEKVEFDKNLAQFTTFKTGGPARYFLAAESVDEIARAIKIANEYSIDFFLLGGGSNILLSDDGFDGLIIKVGTRGITLLENNQVYCAAGESLQALVDFAAEHALTSFEFAAGIFGSVGGAIYGNAGAFGGEIADVVSEVTLVGQDGGIKRVDNEYCRFAYRDSYLKVSGEVIAEALFQLKPGIKSEIAAKIDGILKLRKEKHPVDENSAGSFFKNIPDPNEKFGKLPAGRLLEEAGAKELSVGGAQVYRKHANIIINDGTATSKDISDLADKMKKKVLDKFGIELEEEVIRIGNF